MTKQKDKQFKEPYRRHRDKSYPSVVSGRYEFLQLTKSSGIEVYLADVPRVKLVNNPSTMDDVVTPAFSKIQASGGIVNTGMTQASTSYQTSDSGFEVRSETSAIRNTWRESKAQPWYFGFPGHIPHGINVKNLQNYASVKALAGMKPSSFMGFVALAEGGKTFRMLLNPLSSLRSLLDYLANQRRAGRNLAIHNKGNTLTVNGRVFQRTPMTGRWSGPGRVITPSQSSIVIPAGDAISGSVLANNLGLRPLLMDIESILNEIPKLHQGERLSSRSTISDSSTKVVTATVTNPYNGCSATRIVTTQTQVKVRASVLYEDVFDTLQDFGLSLWDLPSSFWEIVPYSFLLDYLINIGDLLSAIQMYNTRRILCSTQVVTIDTVTTGALSGLHAPGFTVYKDLSGIDTVTSHEKYRIPRVETPTLAYRPLSKIFRPTVIQNTISLIVQQLAHLGKPSSRTFY